MLYAQIIIASINTAAIEDVLWHQSLYYARSIAYPISCNRVEVPISVFKVCFITAENIFGHAANLFS